MLIDSGPVRSDGSDKFFGMENVSLILPGLYLKFSADDTSMETHGTLYSFSYLNMSTHVDLVTAILFYNACITPFPFENRSSTTPSALR
jgi:hypothetical protein